MGLWSSLVLLSYLGFSMAYSPALQNMFERKRHHAVEEGCSTCCHGQNDTCYSFGKKMGGEGHISDRCFCDSGCLDIGDCCENYSELCKAVDCEVSEWSEYGHCDKRCGLGSKSRTRDIIQQPLHGGRECPPLKEQSVCTGRKCKSTRTLGRSGSRKVEWETAQIMEAKFGAFREKPEYNPDQDIRSNLWQKYYKHSETPTAGYCSRYRISSNNFNCDTRDWTSVLRRGNTICVECQKTAMKKRGGERCVGHGRIGMKTSWKALVPGCRGWWTRIDELSECSCDNGAATDFIFV